jgi:DnaB helicase-like protein
MSQLIDPSIARQFDKLPPHSIEAEMCLLASMMLDKEVVGNVVRIVDRDAFYQADHQILYDILLKLYEQNRPNADLREKGAPLVSTASRGRADLNLARPDTLGRCPRCSVRIGREGNGEDSRVEAAGNRSHDSAQPHCHVTRRAADRAGNSREGVDAERRDDP